MDSVTARVRSAGLMSCSYSQLQASRRAVSTREASWLNIKVVARQRKLVAKPSHRVCVASRDEPSEEHRDSDVAKMSMGLVLMVGSILVYVLGADIASAADLDSSREPAFHPVAADLQNLAENEDFWGNLARYGRYFLTVLLGTAYTAIKPVGGLLKRPVTAVVTVGAFVGLYFFLNATLKGMLGVGQEPLQFIDY